MWSALRISQEHMLLMTDKDDDEQMCECCSNNCTSLTFEAAMLAKPLQMYIALQCRQRVTIRQN